MPPKKKQRCLSQRELRRELRLRKRQQRLRAEIDRMIFDSKDTIMFRLDYLPYILKEIEYFQRRIQNGDVNHVKEMSISAQRCEQFGAALYVRDHNVDNDDNDDDDNDDDEDDEVEENNDCKVKTNDDHNGCSEGKDNSVHDIIQEDDEENPDPHARYLRNKLPLHRQNMTKIGQAIAMFPNLEELTIEIHCFEGFDLLQPILKAVAQSSSLRVLHIDPHYYGIMTDSQIQDISIGIQAFHSLEEFSMHHVQSDSISSAIITVRNLKTLKFVDRREYLSPYPRVLVRTLPVPTFQPIFEALSTRHRTLVEASLEYFFCFEGFGLTLRNALEHHSTLTSLFLGPYNLTEEEWRRAVPFLSTNTTLQSLCLRVYRSDSFLKKVDKGKSSSGIWSVETVEQIAMNDSTSLEKLRIMPPLEEENPSAHQYIQAVELLTNNITLNEIELARHHKIGFTKNEYDRLLEAAKRNYGINHYMDIYDFYCVGNFDDEYDDDEDEDGDDDTDPFQRLRMIENMNRAGRRYLKDDSTSRKRGVDVLSNLLVRNDLDAIFFHLLENPSLCQM